VTAFNGVYNGIYERGGFRYDLDAERRDLAVVAEVAGWKPGDRIVEVGAGMGHHATLLTEAGYRVTAVEASPVGAQAALGAYPGLDVVCADATEYQPRRKGHVFARGMSWFHYELDGVNCKGVDVPAGLAHLMGWVAPGRTFVLQIVTDLSGSRPGKGKVHNNQAADYLGLFGPHGDVSICDWRGRPLAAGHDRGVIVVCRTPARRRRT
jgi:SAM-dependent methyltransferase